MNSYQINKRLFSKFIIGTLLAPSISAGKVLDNNNGKLLIIGGAEDRSNERIILKKFIELSGGLTAKLKFILTASSDPRTAWDSYSKVFNLLATSPLI
jgi:cyanophycinase